MDAIDEVCRHLRAVKTWPAVRALFSDCGKLKMAESLAIAGDQGRYLFSLLEGIQPMLLDLMISALGLLREFRQKTQISDAQRKDMCGRLFQVHSPTHYYTHCSHCTILYNHSITQVMAKLEMALPLYWSTFTRHGAHHLGDQNERAGSFWAHNMLQFERFHVLLKNLARGSRNVMASIAHHFQMLGWAQSWRLEAQDAQLDPKVFVRAPLSKTLTDPQAALVEAAGLVKPLGSRPTVTLDDATFKQVQDTWALEDKNFKHVLKVYRAGRRLGAQGKLWDFRLTDPTPAQEAVVGMTNMAQVHLYTTHHVQYCTFRSPRTILCT
jgi:hypothetical protein